MKENELKSQSSVRQYPAPQHKHNGTPTRTEERGKHCVKK
jgi:hypothetical protein